MITLLRKELAGFFSSLTGYVVISVFLIGNSLFLWVFPGQYNVLEVGYSDLNTLFFVAPWIFLFLVPAVCMRLFSDEKRTGTIEILYTGPLTNIKIILAKYFAGVLLVLFSLLPSLIYFVTVYQLGEQIGNIDTGATWGSYIGLFFLASVYVATGVFASSLTDNQIIAFLLSMIVSFFLYIGFESISSMDFLGSTSNIIENLGINAHYKSMSRGVIDSRDVVYFLCVTTIFIFSTKTVLEKKKN